MPEAIEMKAAVSVLVIERAASEGARVRALLAESGPGLFAVEEARSLEDAERRLVRWQPDVILLGVEHAEETAAQVRILETQAPEAPIILLAGGDAELGGVAILGGAQDLQPRRTLDAAGLVRSIRFAIERKRCERRLSMLACTDPLTGLRNRLGFGESLERALERSNRRGLPFTLMFIDLDRFKQVNDAHGHAVGDELLRRVAERLQHGLREGDTVARLGGDEFVVLAEALATDEDAAIVADRLCSAVGQPFDLSGREVNISASAGVAMYPADAPDVDRLLCHADQAMYRTKKSGGNGFQFYAREREGHLPGRFALEARLREAVTAHEFALHYQPQLDVRTGQVVGVEALLRWRRDANTLTQPDAFVPILEETGLILPVGEWVLEEACAQIAAWRLMGIDLRLAVNVSARQLRSPELATTVARILRAHDLPPSILDLELTEGLLIENTQTQRENLKALRALGVGIALDDFGTGYSSLSYLRHLPIDSLKIDRSFLADVGRDYKARAIGRTIIQLAHCGEIMHFVPFCQQCQIVH